MPALADRWRLLAPDFPGCGFSATPADFAYDFDGYARFLERFTEQLGVQRCVVYLHDFGSQIGLRVAIRQPDADLHLLDGGHWLLETHLADCAPDPALPRSSQLLSLYERGDAPVLRAKKREKYAGSTKPQVSAISVTLMFV